MRNNKNIFSSISTSFFHVISLDKWNLSISGHSFNFCRHSKASQVALVVKNPPANARDMSREFDPWVRKVPWRRVWQPLLYSCLENPMDRGAWQATRLKQLSTHAGIIRLESYNNCFLPLINFYTILFLVKPLSHYTVRILICLCLHHVGFPGGSVVKNPPANAGDMGSVPGSGRFPGEGNGKSLQCSCLGNPMDREA